MSEELDQALIAVCESVVRVCQRIEKLIEQAGTPTLVPDPMKGPKHNG